MCSYLEWELTVGANTLKRFEAMVTVNDSFNGPGPYPTYILSMFCNHHDYLAPVASDRCNH
jgi:hypothetical protein